MASLQRFAPATCPLKFNKSVNSVQHVAGTKKPQIGVAPLQKHQFTWGDMSLQHIPGTCTRNIFMCVQILWFCPCYMSPLHVPATCRLSALHTASPSKIWINQSALSRRQKLYCPDVITQTSLSALASQNSFFRRAACSLSLIIYNKGNGEIFIQSEEENGSRHLWC